MSKMGFAVSFFFRSAFEKPIYLIKTLISFGNSSTLKVPVIKLNQGKSYLTASLGLEKFLSVGYFYYLGHKL